MKKISEINNIISVIITSILITLIISGCKDKGVDIQPIKNPRSYSWTVDTLTLPNSAQTLMQDLWGTSPKDVYAVGHNDQTIGDMWHYDGNSWTDVKLSTLDGGNVPGHISSLNAIMGSTGSDIWAVGDKVISNPTPPPINLRQELLVHYNGTNWDEVGFIKEGFIQDIYVQSSNNIWACGDTTIFHYNGIKWTREYVPLVTPPNHFFQIYKIISNGTFTYALGFLHNNLTGDENHYFFKKDETGWRLIISSSSRTDFGTTSLWFNPSGKLYSSGYGGIYIWNGSTWSNIFSITNIARIYGTSDTNIFADGAVGTTSYVYHYNGQDWKKLDDLTTNNVLFLGIWTDGTEAFIGGHTLSSFPQKTIILHGK